MRIKKPTKNKKSQGLHKQEYVILIRIILSHAQISSYSIFINLFYKFNFCFSVIIRGVYVCVYRERERERHNPQKDTIHGLKIPPKKKSVAMHLSLSVTYAHTKKETYPSTSHKS